MPDTDGPDRDPAGEYWLGWEVDEPRDYREDGSCTGESADC